MHPVPAKPIPSVTFDSSEVEPGLRFDAWRANTVPFDIALPEGTPPGDLAVKKTTWNLGALMLTVGLYCPLTIIRKPHRIRTDQIDHYVLQLSQASKGLQLDADGHAVVAGGGLVVMTDLARPETVTGQGGPGMLMYFPRDALDELLPRPLALHGVMPQGACADLFADHLTHLARRLPELRADDAAALSSATLHLLAASLAPTADTLAQARPAVESTLLRQTCKHIELHLDDAGLSPGQIAAFFKISRATLYRLFEPLGGVAAYIMERRLNRVHELLLSAQAKPYLAGIADRHGFKSQSHFSKAFRQHYGYSPRDARAFAGRAHTAPGSQAQKSDFEAWLRSMRA